MDICLFFISFWKLFRKDDNTNILVWKTVQGSCGGILGITILALTNKWFTAKIALFPIGIIVAHTIYYIKKSKTCQLLV